MPTPSRKLAHILAVVLLLTWARAAAGQEAVSTAIFPHTDGSRWWLSGQLNLIEQAHGRFTSPYEGEHSLRGVSEHALSRVWTIDSGVRIARRTELFLDVESAGGRGLSDALGAAGFTNLDVVRNPSLGSAPYVARVMIRQVIALSHDTVEVAPGPLGIGAVQPARRIEIRAGKMSMADFFDVNTAGSDSHLQFTNWTVDNNGAYDYAADTRGYTYAAIAEVITPGWTVRVGEALMPTVANGIDLDWNVRRARGDNAEFEWRPVRSLTLRSLAYANHAHMGDYGEAIAAFEGGAGTRPDIEAHRRQGRVKYGVGENVEYAITDNARLFGRAGWNEGRNESFAYTEVNNTLEAGAVVAGASWRRAEDRAGLAFVSNGLSALHQEYLRLGGLGFLLGDGTLRYARESIVEGYYTVHVWRGVFASADVQRLVNPGYNRDRGPVTVGGLRLHVDF